LVVIFGAATPPAGGGLRTTVGSLADRAVASSRRICVDAPWPRRGAVTCRRASDVQSGQVVVSGTVAIEYARSKGPQRSHRNW